MEEGKRKCSLVLDLDLLGFLDGYLSLVLLGLNMALLLNRRLARILSCNSVLCLILSSLCMFSFLSRV